jgi:hypothetical protein
MSERAPTKPTIQGGKPDPDQLFLFDMTKYRVPDKDPVRRWRQAAGADRRESRRRRARKERP